ncbi:hypothetical protein METHB2_1130002 [Candidatus Methylobacter favarea]|uniref:Uncharacterized protein n=1 Tax=Candidatus Methylobacter favarea TaxID=2707345 RepID=A0A8S0XQY1_9GAMM|nr:hypothetical protein METHB2_1130002 [Candidatus Methylobacter favarea]
MPQEVYTRARGGRVKIIDKINGTGEISETVLKTGTAPFSWSVITALSLIKVFFVWTMGSILLFYFFFVALYYYY